MRIAVVGAGGVGGYFGSQLAANGEDVVFVARGAHGAAIREHGLLVRSDEHPQHLTSPNVVESVDRVEEAELVVLAVKLWDTDDVARSLAPLAEAGAAVVSLQNGVQKDDVLRRYLPRESILGGACYISAFIESPGVIAHHGALQRIVLGEYDRTRSDRVLDIVARCRAAGINAEASDDIERELWEKYVFLVGMSALTSATRLTMGPIRANHETRRLLAEVMAEAVAVGRARGVHLDDGLVAERLAFIDTVAPGMTSSMANDLAEGRRLELPWLSGGVVSLAAEDGIGVPANRTIAALLAPYVDGGVAA
ncbi:ketopantoate reductase family protein [Humibacter ginsenosidimutans]|uniref:2-dehydropantoate 2-reductase n=1 Tax=Humibacter ginsenosidimutans TaxID=2599293 RepID=A0A5B8M8M4_9MICO|nr:ketopantoate reductase family protein [Humibacter ginsenosidimutans]QDZ16521.1 ketopantoate reductase family protein [Humibacter ginsenosidimutans]